MRVGGGDGRQLPLRAPAGLTHPRGLFGRHHVAEGAERERSVRAALPMGSEEPLLLAVPVRPTRESVEHAVEPLLRTAVAIVWVDRAGELARAHLPPGALREIVQSGSQRGRTLAVCAGDLLPSPLRPLHSRPLARAALTSAGSSALGVLSLIRMREQCTSLVGNSTSPK